MARILALIISCCWIAYAFAQSAPFMAATLNSNTVTIKTTRGYLDNYSCYNPNGSVVFVQVFDLATTATGSVVPKMAFALPATGIGFQNFGPNGVGFGKGIQIAATTTYNGTTSPGSAVNCNFSFR